MHSNGEIAPCRIRALLIKLEDAFILPVGIIVTGYRCSVTSTFVRL